MTDDQPAVYTLHALGDQAASVIAEIQATGKPAFITRYGQFVAVITPLEPGEVESRVLPEMARAIRSSLAGDSSNEKEAGDGG